MLLLLSVNYKEVGVILKGMSKVCVGLQACWLHIYPMFVCCCFLFFVAIVFVFLVFKEKNMLSPSHYRDIHTP